jgi:5-methylcytosine-specific restriction endonuclease McrA
MFENPSPGEVLRGRLCALYHMSPKLSFWNADHIIPFSEKGSCELKNLRTLCYPCHKKTTAKWIKERLVPNGPR